MTLATAAVGPDVVALRRRRAQMLADYAARLRLESLRPTTVRLSGGVAVQVDGATPDGSLVVEVDAHDDPAAEGLRARIGQALLTLTLVRRERPEATYVLLVPDDAVRRAAAAWLPAFAGSAAVLIETPRS